MKLYNTVFMQWLRVLVSPFLFLTCSAVTLLLYVTFRPAGLPMLVYCWFPLVAVVTIIVVTWLIYDAVSAKRSADEVLANLQSRTTRYYERLEPEGKIELERKGRALQPVQLRIGEFAEFSLHVVATIWNEVVNQLIFLLTL